MHAEAQINCCSAFALSHMPVHILRHSCIISITFHPLIEFGKDL